MNDLNEYHTLKKYEQFTTRGQKRFIAEVGHAGLKTHRYLVDSQIWMLEGKIQDQFIKWDEIWSRHWQQSQIHLEKEINLNSADEKTKDCQDKIKFVNDLLKNAILKDYVFDWDSLFDKTTFNIPNPIKDLQQEVEMVTLTKKAQFKDLPDKPDLFFSKPILTTIDKIFKSLAQKKTLKAQLHYDELINFWKLTTKNIEINNDAEKTRYEKEVIIYDKEILSIKNKFNVLEQTWEFELDEFYKKQQQKNLIAQNLLDTYNLKNSDSIVEYCHLTLNQSDYPENFPREFDIEYDKEKKFLIMDYVLPSPDDVPKLMEVKYIAVNKQFKEYNLSEAILLKMYDNLIYNVVLRTLFELYKFDTVNAIDTIVLNGWVKSINKATGKMTNNCIVSIQVKKINFLEIDLLMVDAKSCFKSLKGLGSSKLNGITAIQPIISMNKNDKRFVSSYDVADSLNECLNLAAMGWEDFEHLIRELFEKEFSSNGGEVKVTQASRDGGVDAVAYDPDPIRGGKIVIQAKRYTNTVGVSAIRDLYGTVLNEGATKGILVTTSDYGPDAYEFAKNKPLTLLSGNNLLYLLEKHGHKARIDLMEAKKILKELS